MDYGAGIGLRTETLLLLCSTVAGAMGKKRGGKGGSGCSKSDVAGRNWKTVGERLDS